MVHLPTALGYLALTVLTHTLLRITFHAAHGAGSRVTCENAVPYRYTGTPPTLRENTITGIPNTFLPYYLSTARAHQEGPILIPGTWTTPVPVEPRWGPFCTATPATHCPRPVTLTVVACCYPRTRLCRPPQPDSGAPTAAVLLDPLFQTGPGVTVVRLGYPTHGLVDPWQFYLDSYVTVDRIPSRFRHAPPRHSPGGALTLPDPRWTTTRLRPCGPVARITITLRHLF